MMPLQKLNVAIIGCGNVAEYYHLPALTRIPNIVVKAVVDKDQTRIAKAKQRFPICLKDAKAYDDHRPVLSTKEIDAVLILTPPSLHAPIAIECIKSNKHIFCEKPLALSSAEAIKIADELEGTALTFMVGFNYRFMPHFQFVKRFLDEGRIGDIVTASTRFLTRLDESATFQRRRALGGGVLFEMACHHIDVLKWIFGPVKAVQGMARNRKFQEADDNVFVLLEFCKGVLASVHASWTSARFVNRVDIFGDKGMLGADLQTSHVETWIAKKMFFRKGPRTILVGSVLESYANELRAFAEAVLKNKESPLSIGDALDSLRIVERFYVSSELGCKEAV